MKFIRIHEMSTQIFAPNSYAKLKATLKTKFYTQFEIISKTIT